MNKLNLFTISILLATSIVSCNKNKHNKTLKFVGVATTYESRIKYVNDSSYHSRIYDTLDFELTVIIEGKTIQFLSTNDSIIESRTFRIKDSALNNNTYFSKEPGKNFIDRTYILKNDSLTYKYQYYQYNFGINSYAVKFTGIKQ